VVKPGMIEMEVETEILMCALNVCSKTSTMLPWCWTGFAGLNYWIHPNC